MRLNKRSLLNFFCLFVEQFYYLKLFFQLFTILLKIKIEKAIKFNKSNTNFNSCVVVFFFNFITVIFFFYANFVYNKTFLTFFFNFKKHKTNKKIIISELNLATQLMCIYYVNSQKIVSTKLFRFRKKKSYNFNLIMKTSRWCFWFFQGLIIHDSIPNQKILKFKIF